MPDMQPYLEPIEVAGIDVDGVLRGKIMNKNKFKSALKSGFGFCSVIFGWDIHDAPYQKELAISNVENGYKDIEAVIDEDSVRQMVDSPTKFNPQGRTIPFYFLRFLEPGTNRPLHACPRSLLHGIEERLETLGLRAFAGAEFEYFNFAENPESAADKKFVNLKALSSGMHGYSILRPELNKDYFMDLYNSAFQAGIPLEGHHTETGPGVYETAIEYGPVLRTADSATLFKLIAKKVGYKYNVMPTFMAKPYGDLPGCSGHLHVSLQNSAGDNIFALSEDVINAGGRPDAANEHTRFISKEAEYFLAGLMEALPDLMVCFVPTINGYKRLVESFWAPVYVTYAYESRLASVRVLSPPGSSPKATRLEVRVPGADVQPHIALAAIYAAGLHGIQNKTPLRIAPLDTRVNGVESVKKIEKLPGNLGDATARFLAPASLARTVLGDAFVDHYGATRKNEWDQYCLAVTDWERQRYFELA